MVSVSDTIFFTIFAFAFRLLTVHSASGFRAPHVHRSQFWTIHSAPLVLTSLSVYRALIVYFFIIARNFTLFFIQLISFSHFEKCYQIHIDYLFFLITNTCLNSIDIHICAVIFSKDWFYLNHHFVYPQPIILTPL